MSHISIYDGFLQADECDEENTISSISMAQKTPASQPEKDIGSSINYNLTIFQSAVLGSIAWFVLIFCFPRGVRVMHIRISMCR